MPRSGNVSALLLTCEIASMLVGASSSGGPGYYVDSSAPGDPTSSVDVGALAGTGVYAPVDGRVVSLRPYVINGRAWGTPPRASSTGTVATNAAAIPTTRPADTTNICSAITIV